MCYYKLDTFEWRSASISHVQSIGLLTGYPGDDVSANGIMSEVISPSGPTFLS